MYNFKLSDAWLKSGKAGPKSGARWRSQHYGSGRAMSTLAGTLLGYAQEPDDDPRLPSDLRSNLSGITDEHIGAWMMQNTARHGILLAAAFGAEPLRRLEQIAHAVLKPVFERRGRGASR